MININSESELRIASNEIHTAFPEKPTKIPPKK